MHCASVPLKERHMQAFLWHVVAYGIVQRMLNVKSQVSHIGLQVWLLFSLRTIRTELHHKKKRKFLWPGVGMFQELSQRIHFSKPAKHPLSHRG